MAHDHVADEFRGQARALDGGAAHGGAQVDRRNVLEGTTKTTDGGTDGAEDKNIGRLHECSLGIVGSARLT
ncbi:hypothetical protein D3C81_2215830 [compost metagenome]